MGEGSKTVAQVITTARSDRKTWNLENVRVQTSQRVTGLRTVDDGLRGARPVTTLLRCLQPHEFTKVSHLSVNDDR